MRLSPIYIDLDKTKIIYLSVKAEPDNFLWAQLPLPTIYIYAHVHSGNSLAYVTSVKRRAEGRGEMGVVF